MGWLLLALVCAGADLEVIRVIGTADVGCRTAASADFTAPGLPRRRLGGLAGLARTIADNRTGATLVLDCGGFASGSSDADSSLGRAAVKFMNRVKYDAAALGARDFCYGAENLEILGRLAAFPMLADPMLDIVLNRRVPLFRPYMVEELRGVRVGVVAVTDPRIPERNLRDDTRGLAVDGPVAQVRRCLSALEQESSDVVVVVGHISVRQAQEVVDSLARVDLVLCSGVSEPAAGARVLACGRYGQRVAVADIHFDKKDRRVREVRTTVLNVEPADSANSDSVVVWNPVEYSLDEAGVVGLGNLVAEQVRRGLDADLALLPEYAVEPGLERDGVTGAQLAGVAPFPDRLRLVVLHDTLLQSLLDSVEPAGLAPFIAGADYFVTGDTARWPLAAQAARIRYRQPKHVFRVVTTEQLLERSGMSEKGQVAGRLTQVWFAAATAGDTLAPVPVPKRYQASPGVVAATDSVSFPININTATVQLLDKLPGVGPMTAQRIVEYREANGRFSSVDDLLNVKGIGPKRMEQLRPLVSVR